MRPWRRKRNEYAGQLDPDTRLNKSNTMGLRIITDEPITNRTEAVLDFPRYSEVFAEIIKNSPSRFSIGIFGSWGTGKTTLMRMIEEQLHKNDKILTIWFDAWRYEYERYLAITPLLKLIKTQLENNQPKTGAWIGVRSAVERTFTAFIESTTVNVGLGQFGSIQANLDQVVSSLKEKDPIWLNGQQIRYHTHPTEYIRIALEN